MNEAVTEAPKFDQFLDCIHCGLCLPACPTFTVLGTEMDSPRGRIYLMRALAEGKIGLNDAYEQHIDSCLVCRACETACPSGVQFGDMMEAARAQREQAKPSFIKKLLLTALRKPALLRSAGAAIRIANHTGITALVGKIGSGFFASLTPDIPAANIRKEYEREIIPAIGERRYRVGFLRGCVADVFFSRANLATVKVLALNGCEVVMPPAQTCCGALHAHNGLRNVTRDCARQNIDAFLNAGVDHIITDAAGCGATLKEYDHLLEEDNSYAEKAKQFVAKMRDISEFLASIELKPFTHPIAETVAYHDACHLAHGQNIREAPRTLLKKIPGLQLAELNDGEMCCGSAGIYNILQPELSQELQKRKMEYIRKTGASIVAAANPGCVMQIISGAKREGLPLRVVHPIELVAAAYGIG
jgi:glycolate oxidase iron-sulfur subunit